MHACNKFTHIFAKKRSIAAKCNEKLYNKILRMAQIVQKFYQLTGCGKSKEFRHDLQLLYCTFVCQRRHHQRQAVINFTDGATKQIVVSRREAFRLSNSTQSIFSYQSNEFYFISRALWSLRFPAS